MAETALTLLNILSMNSSFCWPDVTLNYLGDKSSDSAAKRETFQRVRWADQPRMRSALANGLESQNKWKRGKETEWTQAFFCSDSMWPAAPWSCCHNFWPWWTGPYAQHYKPKWASLPLSSFCQVFCPHS